MKIDTQGYELEVLLGAQTLLPQIPVIELEVSLYELYKGQPLFPDVHRYLSGRGYLLSSLEECFANRANGQILQADCIYVKAS